MEKARPCQATEIRPAKRQRCEPGSERPAVAALPSAAACAGGESPFTPHTRPIPSPPPPGPVVGLGFSAFVPRVRLAIEVSRAGVGEIGGEMRVRGALLASGGRWGLPTLRGRGGGRERPPPSRRCQRSLDAERRRSFLCGRAPPSAAIPAHTAGSPGNQTAIKT